MTRATDLINMIKGGIKLALEGVFRLLKTVPGKENNGEEKRVAAAE